MQKRDLETYGSILGNHLEKVTEEIENLEKSGVISKEESQPSIM